ncbi:MAG: hypothetical protein ABIQ06_07610 [Caldimonas sp.]
MTAPLFAADACRIALATLLVTVSYTVATTAAAQSRAAPGTAVAPPTSLAEASQLFRTGRHAAAYGRFVRLANEGDREAARVALVMHRHGSALFGSSWDASTEELILWSALAQAAGRAQIEARERIGRGGASALVVGGMPREAANLSPESFRGDRRKKR